MASIEKRAVNGGVRYDVRYRVNGRQHEKAFKRKVDAAKFRATVEADLARGDWLDQRLSKQTVGEFAEQWFATLGGHRAATRSRYRAILDRPCVARIRQYANRPTRPSQRRRMGSRAV